MNLRHSTHPNPRAKSRFNHSLKTALRYALIGIVFWVLDTHSACAEIVFDSGADVNTGFFSDPGSNPQQIFDNFTLSSGSTVDRITWTGVYASQNVVPDNFTIELFSSTSSSGVPSSTIASFSIPVTRVATGDQLFSTFDVYQYTADITPTFFNANTEYHLNIRNNVGEGWAWLTDTTQGAIIYRIGTGGFNRFNATMDFQLELISAPEPGNFLMFMCACAFVLRRRPRG